MEHGPADHRGHDRVFARDLYYLWIGVAAEMVDSQARRRRRKDINIGGDN